jgi:hypothetical protein
MRKGGQVASYLLALAFLMVQHGSAVDSLTEPGTVIIGQVFNNETSPAYILRDGAVEWSIQSVTNPSKIFRYRATIQELGSGNFFFRFAISHQAALSTFRVNDSTVPLAFSAQSYNHVSILVNGAPATIRGGANVLAVSQESRGGFQRIDLDVSLQSIDTDGDLMPDWWERLHGLDYEFPDGDLDPDGDLTYNLDEYRNGTDPNVDDGVPQPKRMLVHGTEAGTTGVRILATDSNTEPANIVYTLASDVEGGTLSVLGVNPSLTGGATFTQRNVDRGQVIFARTDTTRNPVRIPVRISDGDPAHAPVPAIITVDLKRPSRTDGRDSVVWLDGNHVTEVILSDRFERANGPLGSNDNALGGSTGAAWSLGSAPASVPSIVGNRAVVSGTDALSGVISPDHNFIGSSLTDSGGIMISFDVVPPAGGANAGVAFSMGHNAATRTADGASVSAQAGWSIRFQENGKFTTFDADGTVPNPALGLPFTSAPSSDKVYHVELIVRTASFAQGSPAEVSATVDGTPIEVGGADSFRYTFAWNQVAQNFFGLEAIGGTAAFDNLKVTTLPLAGDVRLTHWADRSGASAGASAILDEIVRTDADRALILDNATGTTQALAFPEGEIAKLFPEGERSLFAVIRADGESRQQILTAPGFEIAAGADDQSNQANRLLFERRTQQIFSTAEVGGQGLVSVSIHGDADRTSLGVQGLEAFATKPESITRASTVKALLGARLNGGTLEQGLDGSVAEFLSFDHRLDFDQSCEVEFYFKSKWDGHVLVDASEAKVHEPQNLTVFTTNSARTRPHILLGGKGPDVLNGGEANDWLKGGPGVDTLTGRGGRDVFIIEGDDVITDFDPSEDILLFHQLLDGSSSDLRDYLALTNSGTNSTLRLDRNGDGSGFTDVVVTLNNVLLGNDQLFYLVDNGAFPSGALIAGRITVPTTPVTPLSEIVSTGYSNLQEGNYSGLISMKPDAAAARPVGLIQLRMGDWRNFSMSFRFFDNSIRLLGTFDVNGVYSGSAYLSNYVSPVLRDGKVRSYDQRTLNQKIAIMLRMGKDASGNNRLAGTLTDLSGRVFTIDGEQELVKPSLAAGNYTWILPPAANANRPLDPMGHGYGHIGISRTGQVVLRGKLGDGQSVTASSFVGGSNRIVWGQWPYGANGAENGFVFGDLRVRDIPESDIDGRTQWVKLPSLLPRPYKDGFAMTDLHMMACRYSSPSRGTRALQLEDVQNNAVVTFAGGKPAGINSPAERPVRPSYAITWSNSNQIRYTSPSAEVIDLTLGGDGSISGSYRNQPEGIATTLGGVVYQKQNIVSGLFAGIDETGMFQVSKSIDGAIPETLTRRVKPSLPSARPGVANAPLDAAAAGTFAGLATLQGGGAPSWGDIRLSPGGSFSLKLVIDGQSGVVRGQLAPDGSFINGEFVYTVRINGIRTTRTARVSLQLGLASGAYVISASVIEGARTFDAVFYRSHFSRTTPATDFAGAYTFSIVQDQKAPSVITDASVFPQGDGVGSLVIGESGSVVVRGFLADGIRFTSSIAISKDGRFPILASPYRGTMGYLQGEVGLRDVPELSDADGLLHWERPVNFRDALYPGGIDHDVYFIASRYQKPEQGKRGLPRLADRTNNVSIFFEGSNLLPTIGERAATWNTANRVLYAPAGNEALQVTFQPETGLVFGSYTDFLATGRSAKRTLRFNGAILQKQNLGVGFFLFGQEGGRFSLVPVESTRTSAP